MRSELVENESGTVLRIQGSLDIAVAEEFHKALRNFLRAAEHPVLDLSAVDSCDTAALQLLWAARKSAKPLRFMGLSSAIAESAAALGLPLQELEPESGEGHVGAV
jgi:anti-anti-sigma factor